jgi:peptidyl-prolyl cis-trans isomerase-like protein 2
LLQVKSRFTTGAASRSFTSTSFDPVTENEFEYINVEKNPKKKGYVQLHTTHGDLNIELHCDITPRACENFITLCERGYYNGVTFHRNIRYSDNSTKINSTYSISCLVH